MDLLTSLPFLIMFVEVELGKEATTNRQLYNNSISEQHRIYVLFIYVVPWVFSVQT